MAKMIFDHAVAYKDGIYPGKTPFAVDQADIEALTALGGREDEDEDDGGLESMTVQMLKDYASTLNIDLTGITKKADIIKAIQTAQVVQNGGQGEGND